MCLPKLSLELCRCEADAGGVRHQVVPQLVFLVDDAAEDFLVAGDTVADEEEGGMGVVLGQGVEDSRGPRRVGAVIDRERDQRLLGLAVEQNVRISAGQPADHGSGSDQREQDKGSETEREGDAFTHARTAPSNAYTPSGSFLPSPNAHSLLSIHSTS